MFRPPEGHWPELPAPSVPAIYLSDRVDCFALIDEIDHEWARRWTWGFTYSSGSKIAARVWVYGGKVETKLYARRCVWVGGRSTNIWLHREITQRAHGPPPSAQHVADHLNGDSLDNRRENLRWATLSQNARNLYGSAWLQLRMDL